MHEEGEESHGSCPHCDCPQCTMMSPMKKEFKMAMLEKKEKMIKAKLEFIGKLKDLITKMPDKKE